MKLQYIRLDEMIFSRIVPIFVALHLNSTNP